MKILFVSKLEGELFKGPSNSVPAQVKAQSKFDDVFWLNMTDVWLDIWTADSFKFAYGAKYSKAGLAEVEKIFARPDLIIFEGFYEYPFSKLADDAVKEKIPYILIPRSQLTVKAQKQKALKKFLGNMVYFNKFASNAAAIQYLTEQERAESAKWDYENFVIPNGMTAREHFKRKWNGDALKAVYIGRINIYQKGLDLLIKACASIKSNLLAKNFRLNIHGVTTGAAAQDAQEISNMLDEYQLGDMIKICPPVFAEEKSNVLKNADMFIMTSRFEGMPMALLEALSYSLPCFVTTGTNMAEEIQAGRAGNIAQIDEKNIAHELLSMVENFPATYELMGKNANVLSQKYSWDAIAKKSHVVYESVTKSGSGRISSK